MRYATARADGRQILGEVVDNWITPLEGIASLSPATSTAVLAAAERIHSARVPLDSVQILTPSTEPRRILCVGLNYRDHIEETGRDTPEYPVLFAKYASSLLGPYDDLVLPSESREVDFEGELAVVIGTAGRHVAREDALDHVLGYSVANDITMRDFQYKTHQWIQGKAWDDSTPIGPVIVTPDEFDPSLAPIRTTINGEVMQSSNTDQLLFDVPDLISLISTFTRLEPGDIVLTGTPGGVGYRRDPKRLLRGGDEVVVEIDGIGRVVNRVVG